MGFKSSREKYQDFVEVDAIVTNITKSTENNPNKIEYKYKYDGKSYAVERNEAFRNGKKIGDIATIKCNPKTHRKSKMILILSFLLQFLCFLFRYYRLSYGLSNIA